MEDDLPSAPMEHSALKIFVVLKSIFRNLSDSELKNARLVNSQWNLVAMSQLISRGRQLSTIKLYSFSSNKFRDRDYGWYLEFEDKRRSLWTDLYGTDCRLIEFRHLHFGYPEKTQDFFKILRSPWLSSLTSLTLSMYSETCEEFVLDWFLPALPNLQNLSCYIKPEVAVESTFSAMGGLITALDPTPCNSAEPKADRQTGSKLHSLSLCFEEACSLFPWTLLDSFTITRLKDLKLEFGDTAALVKCSEVIVTRAGDKSEIEALQIRLTHKPNLKEQVEEAELNSEALAIASAKLCNQFHVLRALNVFSMIPAVHFLVFLEELPATVLKHVELEIAVPRRKPVGNIGEREQVPEFMEYVVPELLFKFPELKDLHVQYLQYYPKTDISFQIRSSRPTLDYVDPRLERSVKQLHFSTIAAEVEIFEGNRKYVVPYLRRSQWQQRIMLNRSSWFQGVVELSVAANGWQRCVEVIDIAHTTLKCVRKLVLRGLADVVKRTISAMYFFPEMDRPGFPKKWFNGQEVSRQYEGLPGMQSLEEFRVEQFGICYHPIVASEVGKKMPRLKLIHLDQEFNNVFSAKYCYKANYERYVTSGKITCTWPPSVAHVKILTNTTDSKRSEFGVKTATAPEYFPLSDYVTS